MNRILRLRFAGPRIPFTLVQAPRYPVTDDSPAPFSGLPQRNNGTHASQRWPLTTAVLLGLIVIGLGFWALNLRSNLRATDNAIARLESEIAQIRANTDATTYHLTTTPDGPPSASGTAYLSVSGSGVLTVAHVPTPPSGMGYQLWFFPTGGANPLPGGFVTIDAHGQGFSLLPVDMGPIATLGISLEPVAGSTSPTGPMILTGSLSGARG